MQCLIYCNIASSFFHAASAKACFGHTEGTAGIHGALIAVLGLHQHGAPPIMHGRSLNPYVSSAFDEWRSTHQNVMPLVAKEVATWPFAPNTLSGCSSFGMSGVNAHALYSAALPQDSEEISLSWLHRRHWPVLVNHQFLVTALWDRPSAIARYAASVFRRALLTFAICSMLKGNWLL